MSDKTYACEHCGKPFPTKARRGRHMIDAHLSNAAKRRANRKKQDTGEESFASMLIDDQIERAMGGRGAEWLDDIQEQFR